MDASDVRALFDRGAADYDRTRRTYIPCFDDFYGAALELLPPDREPPLEVLDLGSGTGLLAALARPLLPRARFTLTDISESMLELARARFAGDASVRTLVADYVDGPIEGRYDVVMSALSLHHTPHERLPAVFRKVHDALLPGGLFVNADQALGTTERNEEAYERHWLEGVLRSGCSEADLAVAQERKKADRTATMEQQLGWMRGAGLVDVDVFHKSFRFTVYAGRRPRSG